MKSFEESFKESMRQTFKTAIQFMNNHNIDWWCCGGTCIGAVRHHDIIPWDDDIDIFVTRKSYNCLLALADELKKTTNIELKAIQLLKGYDHSYAKLINTKTTILESPDSPILSGIWIDVFVLDNYSFGQWKFWEESKLYKEFFITKYQSLLRPLNFRLVLYNIRHGKMFNLHSLFNRRRMLDKSYCEFLKLDSKVARQEGGSNYVSYNQGLFVYNKKWFSGFVEMPFADFWVRVPVGYDDYLTFVYGDYMTPPNPLPVFTHSMYYVNLKERLDIVEVKKRLKRAETKVF